LLGAVCGFSQDGLSLATTCSIGLMSGDPAGRQNSSGLRHGSSGGWRDLWLARLSMTTKPPSRSSGTGICSTWVRKLSSVIDPSTGCHRRAAAASPPHNVARCGVGV